MKSLQVAEQLLGVLREIAVHPVLVDIGASGDPPPIWAPFAGESIYIGFDPDLRELRTNTRGGFFRSQMVNAVVTPDGGQNEATFYLTKSPFCSSTLEPDIEALSSYLFVDLFRVERTARVPALTLTTALQRLTLDRVHWFKTDSQGTDLRLFRSLPDQMRDRVLAVDVEPGLIDAYLGEDLFVEAHSWLVRNGFWLSNLRLGGAVRLRETTLREVVGLDRSMVERTVRPSPGWCEARYLRTLESLAGPAFSTEDWGLAWVFAMADGQWGFALDVAAEHRRRFGTDTALPMMARLPVACIREAARRPFLRRAGGALLPPLLVRIARSVLSSGKGGGHR